MDSSKRPASAHKGRPATDFIRVDRFTDEEKALILAEAEAERRERAEAQPGAWEEDSQAPPEPVADPEAEGGAPRRALVVLTVLTLVAIAVLALVGLAGLGAWLALNL